MAEPSKDTVVDGMFKPDDTTVKEEATEEVSSDVDSDIVDPDIKEKDLDALLDQGTVIELKGRKYDIREAFPLTLGDYEQLEKLGVCENFNINLKNPSNYISFFLVVLRKLNLDVTREDAESLTLLDIATTVVSEQTLREEITPVTKKDPT